jgi:spoIIIJ-associated protein
MPTLDVESLPAKLEAFLKAITKAARLDLKFSVRANPQNPPESESPDIFVDVTGHDTDILLTRGGELLEALDELAARAMHIPTEQREKLSFDSNGFKMLRMEELRLTAITAAERVVSSKTPFTLNPMNARDRRIVHLALQSNPAVRTESEGGGPNRRVIIHPADKK